MICYRQCCCGCICALAGLFARWRCCLSVLCWQLATFVRILDCGLRILDSGFCRLPRVTNNKVKHQINIVNHTYMLILSFCHMDHQGVSIANWTAITPCMDELSVPLEGDVFTCTQYTTKVRILPHKSPHHNLDDDALTMPKRPRWTGLRWAPPAANT